MQLISEILGELDIDESAIINFTDGVPGFEQEKQFVVLPMDDNVTFFYMQSVNNKDLCLLLANPFNFFPDYEVDIPDEELSRLGKIKDGAVAIYAILTVPEDFRQTTANLLAPIVIDAISKKGLQFIPAKSDYNTKHLIFKNNTTKTALAAGKGR